MIGIILSAIGVALAVSLFFAIAFLPMTYTVYKMKDEKAMVLSIMWLMFWVVFCVYIVSQLFPGSMDGGYVGSYPMFIPMYMGR